MARQGIIDDLLQSQDPERSGVRDVRVFAKSSSYAEFSKDTIELHNIIELFNVGKQLYPQEMAMMEVYDRLDEYWNESDIYRRARDIDPQAFSL